MSAGMAQDIDISRPTSAPLRAGLWIVLLAAVGEIFYGYLMYEPTGLYNTSPTLWWALTWLAVGLVFTVDIGVLISTFAAPARRFPLVTIVRLAALANIAAYVPAAWMIATRHFDYWLLVHRAYVMTAASVSLSAWWYWSTLFPQRRVSQSMRIMAMLATFAAIGPQISPPLPLGKGALRGLAEPCIGDFSGAFSAVFSLKGFGFSVPAVIYLIGGLAGVAAIAVLGNALISRVNESDARTR